MSTPSTLWIIHRETRPRAVLARIAGAGENTILGSPMDALFDSASPADVILLAPSGDFESELEFAHRFSTRLPRCVWILLPEAGDLAETRRLFDGIPAEFVRFPPHPDRLRRCIYEAVQRRDTDPLSRRRSRALLANRFSRWFADQALPELIRALDPGLSHIPLLIRGEIGTGRGLLARYVHAFGSLDSGPLRQIPCSGIADEAALLSMIRGTGAGPLEPKQTFLLEEVHRLSPVLQSRVREWIEYGLPAGTVRSATLRWIATADDELHFEIDPEQPEPTLRPDLSGALSGMVLRLTPLRDCPQDVEPFVVETARAWSDAQGVAPRRFAPETLEELRSHPWPGNVAELESVVLRTLAFTNAATIEPHHLRFRLAEVPLTPPPLDRTPEQDAPEPRSASFDPDATPVGFDIEEATARTFDPEELGAELEPMWDAAPIEDEPDVEPLDILATDAEPTHESVAPPPIPTDRESTPEDAAPVAGPGAYDDVSLRRLIGVLAHEVRNPLVSIRTFSELLPENFDDAEFRTHFAELVGADVKRIEAVVAQLQNLAQPTPSLREPVDVAALLDLHLDARRSEIQDRSLLVLKELDRNEPHAFGDRQQLSQAFSGLIQKVLSLVPERGDLYIASKRIPDGLEGRPSLRVLMRYHNPTSPGVRRHGIDPGMRVEGVSSPEASLDFLIAEMIIRAEGGLLTLDTTDAQETVIIVDLPAPPL